jgi:hypothetical protein
MGLSDQQIERYARQIIVPGVGGVAQERLLSSRLTIAGSAVNVAPVLAYLVGAGVGEIRLQLTGSDAAEQDGLIMRAAELNPEVAVKPAAQNAARSSLVLAIADSEIAELMPPLRLLGADTPLIFGRLDEPGCIAILPAPPPCVSCADADLLKPPGHRGDNAGFIAMIAAAEAFKLLARITPAPLPTLLEFTGFACASRQLQQRAPGGACTCSRQSGRVNE